jgi:hypothetical protein
MEMSVTSRSEALVKESETFIREAGTRSSDPGPPDEASSSQQRMDQMHDHVLLPGASSASQPHRLREPKEESRDRAKERERDVLKRPLREGLQRAKARWDEVRGKSSSSLSTRGSTQTPVDTQHQSPPPPTTPLRDNSLGENL